MTKNPNYINNKYVFSNFLLHLLGIQFSYTIELVSRAQRDNSLNWQFVESEKNIPIISEHLYRACIELANQMASLEPEPEGNEMK